MSLLGVLKREVTVFWNSKASHPSQPLILLLCDGRDGFKIEK